MAGERVLVVDDVKIVGTGIKRELDEEGFQTDIALSGKEAIELVKKNGYDVVFVDAVMPEMDGIQTCREIKKISPETELIFMTGRFDKEVTEREVSFIEAGGKVYYLYKPFEPGELLFITKKALAERG